MDDYRKAYSELQGAARALALAAERFAEAAPAKEEEARLVLALCAAVAGLLHDSGLWRKNLPPMARACVGVVRAGTPALVRRLAVEKLKSDPFDASRFFGSKG